MLVVRARRSVLAAALALGLILSGLLGSDTAQAHHPGAGFEHRDSGWSDTQTQGGGVNPGTLEPGAERYFLRRDDCGGADHLHMSFDAGNPDGGDGCGYIPPGWNALNEAFAALGDEEGLTHAYPAEEGLPFTLDGSAPVTGRVVVQSYRGSSSNPGGLGAGVSRLHVTLDGRTAEGTRATIGQAIVEYVVTPAAQRYEVDFELPAPSALDGAELETLVLHVRLDGPAANHGFIALSGSSYVDVPGTPGTGVEAREVPDTRLSDIPCEDGRSSVFDCDGVDLLSFVPASEIDSEGISDIWGWTDPESGDEYVMMGKTNGTAFFRVTDAFAPEYLGALPNPGITHAVWHDIKVHDGHAFIVSESDLHGMVVFDLTRLRGVTEAQEWDADAIYDLNWAAHNIVINEDTGYAYIVGGNAAIVAPDQCLSGLHIVDVNDPKDPTFAGCYALEGGPGTAARTVGPTAEAVSPAAYVHDAQCVIYDGPDERYLGQEICLMASENKVVIADVTNKALPTTVGVVEYPNATYAHQGWLSDDGRYWFVNDELDEEEGIVDHTRTIVIDVSDLENPFVHFEHFSHTVSPDHNNYVHEGLLYQSNYSSGLRILDTSGVADGELTEVAFFDTYPLAEDTFDGTWSNYPYFASGTIAVSGRGEGLFLLRLQDRSTDEPAVEVECVNCPLEIRAGESATLTVEVRNVGNVDDAYDIQVDGLPDGWAATVTTEMLALGTGESDRVDIDVEVSRRARAGAYSFDVTATSTADPMVTASDPIDVEVRKGRPSAAGRSGGEAGASVNGEPAGSGSSGSPMVPAVALLALSLAGVSTWRRWATRGFRRSRLAEL